MYRVMSVSKAPSARLALARVRGQVRGQVGVRSEVVKLGVVGVGSGVRGTN